MIKRCSVCNHPARAEIDRELRAAVPYRTLAGQFSLSTSALCRHSKHLARQLEVERRQEDQSHQDAIIEKLALLEARLDRLFNAAADFRSLHVALGCIRESLRLLALLERVRLPLREQP
jgi:hypothetical protein